jgi:hypothetical protein
MVGDIVNLAARLMVAAGKEGAGVLCDEATYESSRSKLTFTALEPIMVKGKSVPIKIYIPAEKEFGQVIDDRLDDGEDLQSTTRRVVLGREKELTSINALLTELADGGRGKVQIIEGGAGMRRANEHSWWRATRLALNLECCVDHTCNDL